MKTHGHYIVSGWVQGVGFRYWTHKHATKLELTGWVRNLATGEVEIYIYGEEVAVEVMRDWLEKGPVGSHVDKLMDKTDQKKSLGSDDETTSVFEIKATA